MSVKAFFSNWIVRNLIWAVIVVIALVVAATVCLNLFTQHGKEYIVPDFTNMTVTQAAKTAAAAGMRTEVTDSVYVRRMSHGAVYRQNPTAGSSVKKGRRIMLTINSVQPKKVAMPNLEGLSMRQARAELSSRGLSLGKLIYVEDIATNNVMRQLYGNREIAPGTMIASGTTIDLVLGLNPEQDKTFIPTVTGMRYLHAVEVIHGNSLNVGGLVFDSSVKTYDDSLSAVVYRQEPDPNAPAPVLEEVDGEPVIALPEENPASVPMGTEVVLYLSPSKTDE